MIDRVLLVDLTPDQRQEVDDFYHETNDEGEWLCRFCKAVTFGPGCLMAQVGSDRADAVTMGKLSAVKLCRPCFQKIEAAIKSCKDVRPAPQPPSKTEGAA